MFGILQSVFKVLALVAAVIGIVERPGDGAQKKQEVIEIVRERLPEVVALPKWIEDLFLSPSFLGWLIDIIVAVANRHGFFVTSSDGGTTSTAAS